MSDFKYSVTDLTGSGLKKKYSVTSKVGRSRGKDRGGKVKTYVLGEFVGPMTDRTSRKVASGTAAVNRVNIGLSVPSLSVLETHGSLDLAVPP